MNLFNRIFRKEPKQSIPPMPPRDQITQIMYDKGLDTFSDEIVKVIYSKDHSMRYVVLRKNKKLFTYQLEFLYHFDADEWKYIYAHNDALPAAWLPFNGNAQLSFFETVDQLTSEIKAAPEYKKFFI